MAKPIPMIRVRAVRRAKLIARDARGNLVPGRFIGRDRKGAILAAGELVAQSGEVIRAIARGDLEAVHDAPAQEAPEAALFTPDDAPAARVQEV